MCHPQVLLSQAPAGPAPASFGCAGGEQQWCCTFYQPSCCALRPTCFRLQKCKFHRLLISVCLLLITWAQSRCAALVFNYSLPTDQCWLNTFKRLVSRLENQPKCRWLWFMCSSSGICRVLSNSPAVTPTPEPNEGVPTPKCHRHAIGVTIYVKLKRTSKIEST